MSAEIAPERGRLVVFAEGELNFFDGKVAMGVIRYGPTPVVAVIDATNAGRNVREWLGERFDVPVVAGLADALALPEPPTAFLFGIAPDGGHLPDRFRPVILAAIEAGLSIHAGLHDFLGDDPELAAAARRHGVTITDYRRVPERRHTAVGRPHAPGKTVLLLVGTDCAVGKMSVALELRAAAARAGLRTAFVPTGQTGIMIEGWGVAIDRVISDFVQGTCEDLLEQAESRGDWIFVEGQGSLDHPAYSCVTVGLIHGTTPDAMVMVHRPSLTHHEFGQLPGRRFPVPALVPFIRAHEAVASLVAPSRVVAVALNTSDYDEAEARRLIEATAAETGLPVDDPYRFGADRLFAGIRARLGA